MNLKRLSIGKVPGLSRRMQEPVRRYDAMHLAAALLIGADALVKADADLLTAAVAIGLPTVDASV